MIERQTKAKLSSGTRTKLSAEALFDVLKSSYRRYVLSYLADAATPTEAEDLAYHVAAWESDRDVTEVSADDVEEAMILLYHVHLPKMAAVGLVTYDAEAGIVTPGERIDSATDCIRIVE